MRKRASAWEDVLLIVRGARLLPGGGVPNDRLLLEEAEAFSALGRRADAQACLLLLRGERVSIEISARAERLLEEIA